MRVRFIWLVVDEVELADPVCTFPPPPALLPPVLDDAFDEFVVDALFVTLISGSGARHTLSPLYLGKQVQCAWFHDETT